VRGQPKTKTILAMANHEPSNSIFALRMKMARELLGISQMELGIRAGIDESSSSARINQYERGKHTPDFTTASNLANVLGVPLAYFYTNDDGLAEVIATYGKLSETGKKTLRALATSIEQTTKE